MLITMPGTSMPSEWQYNMSITRDLDIAWSLGLYRKKQLNAITALVGEWIIVLQTS